MISATDKMLFQLEGIISVYNHPLPVPSEVAMGCVMDAVKEAREGYDDERRAEQEERRVVLEAEGKASGSSGGFVL